ncbi:triose-phosphate isomerase [bacterium]|nr:MAG: triose-phosphate isomerase [bacterium]
MGNRKPIIAGNWKMYKTCDEAVETAKRLVKLLSDSTAADIVIAPPFTALLSVSKIIKESPVMLGAQNFYWESQGAYTGEISAPMLVSAGCNYVIVGHSERRQYFGETDETVNKKIKAALKNKLTPILCVGESEKQRELNETFSVLDKQIKNGLKGLSSIGQNELVIAYEPVWAIGTGRTATSEQAQEVHLFLRSLLKNCFDNILAKTTRILYGGSVNPHNIIKFISMPDIDGALVGGASLDPELFGEIVHFENKSKLFGS